ncbi:RAB6A-GEF complex partner protein 2 [Cimex lectularius]|uniref:RAB6A-GEF complex partner protein 2 n=1 Tax=Cimex lectularius TaxID=79782 RepID=A0A8I6RF58_CIMLE|nr:RAB6A-GEF complex partner protein 2 [Cimex lectularius]
MYRHAHVHVTSKVKPPLTELLHRQTDSCKHPAGVNQDENGTSRNADGRRHAWIKPEINMIDIRANLINGSVCIPGENIVCCISFRNNKDPSDSSSVETLAWASVQIHCLCSTNSKLNVTSKTTSGLETASTLSDTCFIPYKGDVHGQIVLSTKPKILFCDLQLMPGLSKSFVYTEVLPPEAPPSYRGKLVKYSYKISIGAQRVNSPTKLLRLPLRVLAIAGLPDYSICEDSEDLSPNNPFLETYNKEYELIPVLQLVENITARRNPNFYNITNTKGKVGRFCLFKQAYRLGEDIVGTFDFTKSTVPCLQLTVTLQCEEHIVGEAKSVTGPEIATTSYSKHHEICLHLTHCLLNLPIPLHATPAFATDLLELTWKLHFEFVTGHPGETSIHLDKQTWQAPDSLNIETMVWDLPIQIYPTVPTPEPNSQMQYYLTL